jgi:hypothetical protein
MSADERRRIAVSDPHGHPAELAAALRAAGLVDDEGAWSGTDARLFVLGDFLDRGPDGIGVIDLVMRLAREAPDSGGEVRSLLGNHEALALGMHDFGPVSDGAPSPRAQTFASSWMRNGGLASDQERLTAVHLDWLRSLPAIILDDDLLLLHSDTVEYLEWGGTVDQINTTVRAALTGGGADESWLCWERLTDRYAFMGEGGAATARDLMATLGGSRIVHGHSIIADLTGVPPPEVTGPWSYADGLVLAIDGGLYAGGPLLVVHI